MGRTQRRRRRRNHRPTESAASIDDNKNALSALIKYLHAFGWKNETSLMARHFPKTGRGLYSKTYAIAKGDTIIRLPIQCLITINTLEDDEAFKAYFNNNPKKIDDDDHRRMTFQSLLALYILYQKHLAENSPMNAYIKSLPMQLTVPYFCSIREFRCLPDSLLERTVAQNCLIKENYANILCTIGGDCNVTPPSYCPCCGLNIFEDIFPLDAFKWAYFVVNSRSVYVNSKHLKCSSEKKNSIKKQFIKGDTNLALAPFLDLLNHTDTVTTNAQLELEELSTNYVLKLQDAPFATLSPYEQIFISYGPLTNLKLLTEYGFILHNNRHDYFEFSLQDIEQFLKLTPPFNARIFHRNKFRFIREHNLNDQMFVHTTTDGISHNLCVVLHLLLKEQSYFPNVLNQVAFGDSALLDNMSEEVRELIRYKMDELKSFTNALQSIPVLSESAKMCLDYMNESVQYLECFLEISL